MPVAVSVADAADKKRKTDSMAKIIILMLHFKTLQEYVQ